MGNDPQSKREMQLVAKEIVNARKRAGMTQTALGKAIGTTQSVIAKLESGSALPRLSSVQRIARATHSRMELALPALSRTTHTGAHEAMPSHPRDPRAFFQSTMSRRLAITAAGSAIVASNRYRLPASAQTPAPSGETRLIETIHGKINVPASPQRVVALDPYASLQVLDELGAPLIAAGSLPGGERALVSEENKGLPSVSEAGEIDIEAVVLLEPDLIIGTNGITDPVYDQMAGLAPTVVTDPVNNNWRDVALHTANAVNLQGEMTKLLTGLEDQSIAVTESVDERWPEGITVSVVRVMPELALRSYGTWLTSNVGADVLGRLSNVTVTADAHEDTTSSNHDAGFVEFSLENIREIDADVILYYAGGFGQAADTDNQQVLESFTSHPLFESLDAVQTGKAIEVDGTHWFWGRSVTAAHFILHDVQRVLVDEQD